MKLNIVKEMTEPEYRKLPYLSYSLLAGVDKSPANINRDNFEMTSSLIYGSAVDVLAFDGKEEFKKKFAVLDHNAPSDAVKKIVDEVFERNESREKTGFLLTEINSLDSPLLDNEIYEVARGQDYGAANWKKETIIGKVRKEGTKYFDFLSENKGKLMLDGFMYEKARNSVKTLYEHEFTRSYMNPEDGVEIFFQFPIIWSYKGFDCKSLLDIFIIDHNKQMIKPVDLKTSFDDVMYFPVNYIKWKYYIQAAFYSRAVSYLKLKHPQLLNYAVDYFKFIVISSNNPIKPLVYTTTDQDLEYGEYGGTLRNGQEVKGFDQLIDDYRWHIENGKYQYPREVYEKNGELEFKVWS